MSESNNMAAPVKMTLLIFVNAASGIVDLYRKRQDALGPVERVLVDDFEKSGRLIVHFIEPPMVSETSKKFLAFRYAKYKNMTTLENFMDMTPLPVDAQEELDEWKKAFVGWDVCFMKPHDFAGKVEYDTKIYYHMVPE